MKRTLLLLAFVITSIGAFAQVNDLSVLIDKCSPAIFKITTYDASGNEYAVGTGFFISSSGTALSNYHVFQGASKAKIKTADNKTYLVDNVLGWSKESDLLKFTVKNELNETFPFLKMNATSPKQGEKIFIIGNPLGLEKSVADGIVSSIRQDEKMGETIQITAPISHGNSGSPLMNMNGEALGVVTYYLENGQNLNFAVSVKNLNILDPVNALKYPEEDGQDNVVSNNNDNSNSTNTKSDIYAGSKVSFAEDVDSKGYPLNESDVFNITGSGGNVTVYIDNGSTPLGVTDLTVKIYKKGTSGEYDDYIESKSYTIKSSLVATYFDYFFSETGDYVFDVYAGTSTDTWINSGYVTIKKKDDSGLNIDYDDPSSTFYFMDSKVECCVDLDNNNNCSNPGDVFYVSKSNGSYIYVHVSNPKPIQSSGLTVKIYKIHGKNDDYYETKYFTISPTSKAVYFEYTFYDAAQYRIKVYTSEDVWINDATLTIKYK